MDTGAIESFIKESNSHREAGFSHSKAMVIILDGGSGVNDSVLMKARAVISRALRYPIPGMVNNIL
jgi:hypothetical protein